ncbi:MAG: HNH endonuclease signature motif containing protein [Marmoricola sp.]
MESQARLFSQQQREFLVFRDQICRTPWCNAPVRHADHVVAVEEGGPTSIDNGQGLCQACNLAKSALACQARPSPDGAGDEVVTTTPTGHTYRSRAPNPPGPPRRQQVDIWYREVERQLAS